MDSEKLVNLFWARSPEAIAQTQQAYGALCASLAGRLLRRKEDVEECVNDTYLALWNGIPPARPAHFGAYITKVVRNLAMKRLSYLTAEKRSVEAEVSFEELDACLAGPGDPQQILEGKELENAITAFLRSQDKESRKFFLRRYYFFDSVREIADRYGVNESKVKVKLFRTRNKLKEYLIKEGLIDER